MKLLRFLESGEIRRVGENEPFRVDVRVLCATHRDLSEMINEDLFREDLYFRLNTFEIHLPSLREREDIPFLASHMLKRYHRSQGPLPELTQATMDALQEHFWPGNVRELANAMERAVILAGGRPILPEHLPNFSGRRMSSQSGRLLCRSIDAIERQDFDQPFRARTSGVESDASGCRDAIHSVRA